METVKGYAVAAKDWFLAQTLYVKVGVVLGAVVVLKIVL